ncbi:hypothetical protein B0O80DRAFT_491780 [Mortierella sp. GBAus27b]|nr:hypothetical protein B0O80DRAFT_491780 [Mortierella sp. GBAus27b]
MGALELDQASSSGWYCHLRERAEVDALLCPSLELFPKFECKRRGPKSWSLNLRLLYPAPVRRVTVVGAGDTAGGGVDGETFGGGAGRKCHTFCGFWKDGGRGWWCWGSVVLIALFLAVAATATAAGTISVILIVVLVHVILDHTPDRFILVLVHVATVHISVALNDLALLKDAVTAAFGQLKRLQCLQCRFATFKVRSEGPFTQEVVLLANTPKTHPIVRLSSEPHFNIGYQVLRDDGFVHMRPLIVYRSFVRHIGLACLECAAQRCVLVLFGYCIDESTGTGYSTGADDTHVLMNLCWPGGSCASVNIPFNPQTLERICTCRDYFNFLLDTRVDWGVCLKEALGLCSSEFRNTSEGCEPGLL